MRSIARLCTGLAAFIFIATARIAFAVSCGDTITSDETLTADLNCMSEPALIIGAGGSLDLNGFQVTCNGSIVGISMEAEGTSLSNGSVGNCDFGVVLLGKHKITGVYVFNSGNGIYTTANGGNKIKDVAVSGSAGTGIYLQANNNTVSGVSVRGSGTGVYVAGIGNKLKDVTTTDCSNYGINSVGTGQKVSNIRNLNADIGLHATGTGNKYTNIHSFEHVIEGVLLTGSDSKLSGSTALSRSTGPSKGIAVGGAMGVNAVSKCATLGGQGGILISSASEVSKNLIFGSNPYGINATGGGSSISKNIAVGNGASDLFENSPGCASGNVWSGNIGKGNESCIE